MTRDERDEDPEVVADMRLRAATERDRSRSRPQGYAWKPPKIVAAWRCRGEGCERAVEVPEDAMDAFRTFNAELQRRGESPLESSRILFCTACAEKLRAQGPIRRQNEVERMAAAIRELKASDDPREERELIKQLTEWGHPDVTGLVEAIAQRRAAEAGRGGKHRV